MLILFRTFAKVLLCLLQGRILFTELLKFAKKKKKKSNTMAKNIFSIKTTECKLIR